MVDSHKIELNHDSLANQLHKRSDIVLHQNQEPSFKFIRGSWNAGQETQTNNCKVTPKAPFNSTRAPLNSPQKVNAKPIEK